MNRQTASGADRGIDPRRLSRSRSASVWGGAVAHTSGVNRRAREVADGADDCSATSRAPGKSKGRSRIGPRTSMVCALTHGAGNFFARMLRFKRRRANGNAAPNVCRNNPSPRVVKRTDALPVRPVPLRFDPSIDGPDGRTWAHASSSAVCRHYRNPSSLTQRSSP